MTDTSIGITLPTQQLTIRKPTIDPVERAIAEAKRSKRQNAFIGSHDAYLKKYEEHEAFNRYLSSDNAEPLDWTLVPLSVEPLGILRKSNLKTREQMLLPHFRQGDAMLLYAPAGLGKSFLSMCIGLAVAGSGKIKGIDWSSEVKRKALLVDGEMPMADLKDRVGAIIEGEWIEGLDLEAADQNFQLLSRLGQRMDNGFVDITKGEDQTNLGKYCVSNGISLVILDNFSTLTDSMEEENNAIAFRQLNLFVSKLKRRGISVLLVHHANKEGASFRGSSALAVPYDSIVGMHRVPTSTGDPCFRLAFEKLRTQSVTETQTREFFMGQFGYRNRLTLESDDNLDAVVAHVLENKGKTLSFNGMAKAIDLNRETIEKKLVRALDLGLLSSDVVTACFKVIPRLVQEALRRNDTSETPEF